MGLARKTFQAPKSFIFYRQRPVSRQGRKNNFSGPKKFYFLSPEAGQQARKEKKNFSGPKKFYFLSPEAGQQERKEKKLFRPQKVLFSIARGRSAGKEGKTTFQAPKSFIFYRQRPVSRQGMKNNFSGPKKFYFYRQRPVSRQGRKNNFSGPKKFYFLSPEARQQARKEKTLFRPQKVLLSIARGRSAGKEGKTTFQAPKSFIFYRQRPASWVDGCRSSRIQSCSRRALHLCENVRDVTTQAQEAQRPIRLRFTNPCKDRGSWKKKLEAEKFFFPWGWTLERRPTSYFLPSN